MTKCFCLRLLGNPITLCWLLTAPAMAGQATPGLPVAATTRLAEASAPAGPTSAAGSSSDADPAKAGPDPDVPADLLPLAREAKDKFDHGKYPAAEAIYRQILEKAPDNHYALTNLGMALFREQKFKEASDLFKRILALTPDDSFSHSTLGIVYYNQGKYNDAISELTTAIKLDPKNATAHNYLGVTASQKGWSDVAEKELETATTLDPKYGDAEFNLAVLLATKPSPDMEGARQHYQRAVQLGADRDAALEQLLKRASAGAGSSKPVEPSSAAKRPE